jgi:hypothetical protein
MSLSIRKHLARFAILICAMTGVVTISASPAMAQNWDPVIPYPGSCCTYFMWPGEHLTIESVYEGSPYHLEMQGDGNLVLYSGSHPCWGSGTQGWYGAYARYSWDGHLYVVADSGYVLWDSGFGGAWDVYNVSIFNGRFYVGGRFIASC